MWKELLFRMALAVFKNEEVTGMGLGIDEEVEDLFDCSSSYLKRRIFNGSSLLFSSLSSLILISSLFCI